MLLAKVLSFSSSPALSVVVLLRTIFWALTPLALSYVIDFGTSLSLLMLATCLGTLGATLVAFSSKTLRYIFALLLGSYLTWRVFLFIISVFTPDSSVALFFPYNLLLHSHLFFICLTLSSIVNFLFWRYRSVITIELLLFIIISIAFFASHRHFHFDSPKIINTLAWRFGITNLTMLVLLGTFFAILAIAYLYLVTMPEIPWPFQSKENLSVHGYAPRGLTLILGFLLLVLISAVIAKGTFEYYNVKVGTRIANGVGQESEEGLSPLGFHSALGSSNQPAALVRLENDYNDNPSSPMLYLREAALSEFNGHELVKAGPLYDSDVSFGSPVEAYKAEEDPTLSYRAPVLQAIYLLTDHKRAFAVDYPVSITRLKNPAPERFKAAFKAYSMAPVYAPEELLSAKEGDSRWEPEELKHYIKAHPDKRYAELAAKIAPPDLSAAEQALALTTYLSKNAIYTLTPNHDVKQGEDPVAPFLFGDLRGYCVHFAHAMVYMMRALNIPARVATGYLTDLSQARDGHILLRMSDRHAWAEAYLDGFGWVPFDLQPEQVESHAETPVDMNLLEELMSMLGPSEELLPDELTMDELNVEEESRLKLPGLRFILSIIVLFLLSMAMLKAYLLFSWHLPGTKEKRLKRFMRSLQTVLIDTGRPRDFGETWLEYRKRLKEAYQINTLTLAKILIESSYRDKLPAERFSQIDSSYKADLKFFRELSVFKRIYAFLSPASLIHFLGGRP